MAHQPKIRGSLLSCNVTLFPCPHPPKKNSFTHVCFGRLWFRWELCGQSACDSSDPRQTSPRETVAETWPILRNVSFLSWTLPCLNNTEKSSLGSASAGFPPDGTLTHQSKHPNSASNRSLESVFVARVDVGRVTTRRGISEEIVKTIFNIRIGNHQQTDDLLLMNLTEKPNAAIPFSSSQIATTIEPALSSHAPSVHNRVKRERVGRTSLGRKLSKSVHNSRNPDSADLPDKRRGSGLGAYGRRATRWTPAVRPRRSLPSNLNNGHPFCQKIPCQRRRHPNQLGHRGLRKMER